MTIKTYGVAGSMDTTHFARLLKASSTVTDGHGVSEGAAVTKLAAARTVQIAPGAVVTGGALMESDANVTKVGDANVGSNPRIDFVCGQTDWLGNVDTASSFIIVKGLEAGAPEDPPLTQDPGVKWQEPIARYTMQGGVISDLVPIGGALEIGTVNLPANWSSPASAGLLLEKRAGIVYFGGRLTRVASGFTDSADFTSAAVIPDGFRPKTQKNVIVTSQLSDPTTPSIGHLVIQPNGTMTYYSLVGGVSGGQTLRLVETSWIGA